MNDRVLIPKSGPGVRNCFFFFIVDNFRYAFDNKFFTESGKETEEAYWAVRAT